MRNIAYLVAALLFSITAFALPTFNPQLVLKNQQGEVSNNAILTGSNFIGSKIATHTILANTSGGTTYPSATTYAAILTALGLSTSAADIATLKNGTFTPTTEAISVAGAVSTTIMESTVANAGVGTYAVTLAAPSGQDGQIKIIKAVATMTHTVTLAMTNISMSGSYTPTGTTTLTFTNVDDSAIFMAVGGKWIYLGGSAVAS